MFYYYSLTSRRMVAENNDQVNEKTASADVFAQEKLVQPEITNLGGKSARARASLEACGQSVLSSQPHLTTSF